MRVSDVLLPTRAPRIPRRHANVLISKHFEPDFFMCERVCAKLHNFEMIFFSLLELLPGFVFYHLMLLSCRSSTSRCCAKWMCECMSTSLSSHKKTSDETNGICKHVRRRRRTRHTQCARREKKNLNGENGKITAHKRRNGFFWFCVRRREMPE